jgi:hypothetical protein
MGPELLEALQRSGIPTLAFQAATAARSVRRILSSKALEEELGRTGIRVDGPAIDGLREDLDAIASSLTLLGHHVDDGQTDSAVLWSGMPERGVLTAGLAPVDHLLVQSTGLLSAVSDMARILATIHSRPMGNGDMEADVVLMPEIPRIKLN